MSAESAGVVAELFRYPVKSMGGEALSVAVLTARGMAGDRAFALVDEATGRIASAKHPRKWGALLLCTARLDESSGEAVIDLPDGVSTRTDAPDAERILSRHLGVAVRLVSSAHKGALIEEVWPGEKGTNVYGRPHDDFATSEEPITDMPIAGAAHPGSLLDLAPLHAVTSASLRAAGADRRRFRPNLLIEVNGAGFVENAWRRRVLTAASGLRLKVEMPTPRCAMVNLAQPGLGPDPALLARLAAENRVRAGGLGDLPCLGVYLSVLAPGQITAGDRLEMQPAQVRR